jgi:hypothetical protein
MHARHMLHFFNPSFLCDACVALFRLDVVNFVRTVTAT